MMNWMRGSLSIVTGGLLVLSVSACGTTYSGPPNMLGQPQQLPPVQQSGAVSSNSLPPLSGSTVAQGQVNPSLTGTPVLGGVQQQPSMSQYPQGGAYPQSGGAYPQSGGGPGMPMGSLGTNVPSTLNSTDSLDPLAIPGTMPGNGGGMPGSHNLSGGLSLSTMLGGWTVASGATQCRLNLTQTAKAGTSRYRASAPACQIQGLAATAAWTLQGSQVQLFDEGGSLIAAMVLSGNQFIGTVAGGTQITMAG